MTDWKPRGYNSLSPYLISSDAKATIAFLKMVFDGQELRQYERPDGSIMHAEIRIDDSVVMIGGATADAKAVDAHVHLYVRDVDVIFDRAMKSGATLVQEPIRKGDADKRGGVKDPGGTTWWIATMQVS